MKKRKQIPIMLADNIPSKNFLKKAFEKLKRLPESNYNIFISKYIEIFESFPVLPLKIASKGSLNDITLYRIISEQELLKFSDANTDLKSFAHPPYENCKSQRFNTQDAPALYLSNDIHTAVQETKLVAGQSFYLSEWKFSTDEEIPYILFFDKNRFSHETSTDFEKHRIQEMEQNFRIYPKDKRGALHYYMEQLTNLLLEDEKNFITSCIGNYYLNITASKMIPRLGYVIYPSIAKKRNGFNYAVNPKIFSNGQLYCDCVSKLILTSNSPEGITYDILAYGNCDGQTINWKNVDARLNLVELFEESYIRGIRIEGSNLNERVLYDINKKEHFSVMDFISSELSRKVGNDLQEFVKTTEKERTKVFRLKFPNLIIDDTRYEQGIAEFRYSAN